MLVVPSSQPSSRDQDYPLGCFVPEIKYIYKKQQQKGEQIFLMEDAHGLNIFEDGNRKLDQEGKVDDHQVRN